MNCTVVTPDKTVVEQDAVFVAIPLYDGEYGVLPGHTPMVGRLGSGELRVKLPDGTTESYFVSGGFVEVLEDKIALLTARACAKSEIDTEKVQNELDAALAKPVHTQEHIRLRNETVSACRAQLRIASKN